MITEKRIFCFLTCIYLAFWLGYALVIVHHPMPLRTEPEEYGWDVPFMMAVVTLPTAYCAYRWGRSL